MSSSLWRILFMILMQRKRAIKGQVSGKDADFLTTIYRKLSYQNVFSYTFIGNMKRKIHLLLLTFVIQCIYEQTK